MEDIEEDIDDFGRLEIETTEDLEKVLPLINKALERKYGLPNRVVVGMNDGKAIIFGEKDELLTFGQGCNFVAIEGKTQSGPFGILTHYDPIVIELNCLKISELATELGGKESIIDARAEIFARGEWVKKEEKWTMVPEDEIEIEKLKARVRKSFGEDTPLKISLYDQELSEVGYSDNNKKERKIPSNSVIVNINPKTPPEKRILNFL